MDPVASQSCWKLNLWLEWLEIQIEEKKQEKLKRFIIDHWSSLKLPLGYHSNWCFKNVFNYVHWPFNKWNRIWSDISLTSPESNAQSIPPPPAAGVHGKLPHLSLPLCRNWKNTHHWSLWWIRTSIMYYSTYYMFMYPWCIKTHLLYVHNISMTGWIKINGVSCHVISVPSRSFKSACSYIVKLHNGSWVPHM